MLLAIFERKSYCLISDEPPAIPFQSSIVYAALRRHSQGGSNSSYHVDLFLR